MMCTKLWVLIGVESRVYFS